MLGPIVDSTSWPVQGVLGENTLGMVVNPTLIRGDPKHFTKIMRRLLAGVEGNGITRINLIEASSSKDFLDQQNKRQILLKKGFVIPSPLSCEMVKAWQIADGTTKLESNGIYSSELVQIFTLLGRNNVSHAEYMLNTYNNIPQHELTSRALSLERVVRPLDNPLPGEPKHGWRIRLSLNNWSIFPKLLEDFYAPPNKTSSAKPTKNYKRMPAVD